MLSRGVLFMLLDKLFGAGLVELDQPETEVLIADRSGRMECGNTALIRSIAFAGKWLRKLTEIPCAWSDPSAMYRCYQGAVSVLPECL